MPEHKSLAAALAAAQGELSNVREGGKGNFGKYMTLPDLIDAVRPVLAANGLSWSAMPSIGAEGQPTLRYQLLHASGEFLSGEMALMLSKQDAQGQGSAITYARRYSLASVLNIGADEDDDGHGASRGRQQSQQHRGVQARMAATLPEAKVKELVEAIRSNGCPNEVLRQQLIAVGVQSVPEKVSPSSLSMLTPQQAEKVLAWLSPEPDA